VNIRIGLVLVTMFFCAGLFARINANQGARAAGGIQIGSTDIGGVVTSTKGPEAGVWVIAQTSDLPAPYIKIVVTDDQAAMSCQNCRPLHIACGCEDTVWWIQRPLRQLLGD
jgi:hypothetical protein